LCDESKREHLFEKSSSCWLIAWIFLPISYATTGLRKQKNGLGISQHHLGADIGVEGPPPPSMSRQRSRTSSVPYMASLSSFTQPSVAELRSRMRFLSASAKMQLRSRSVVSSLVISPSTPRHAEKHLHLLLHHARQDAHQLGRKLVQQRRHEQGTEVATAKEVDALGKCVSVLLRRS